MCGITGYLGKKEAVSTAVNSLKRLEYRGYDSAGIAFATPAGIEIIRAAGKIVNLENLLIIRNPVSHVAIAHTRWATHGKPCEENAHPHRDCTGRVAVVHNGIIENYLQLRTQLSKAGHLFSSETDTEAIAHLIETELPDRLVTPEEAADAIRAAFRQLHGSFAAAVLISDTPSTLYAARKDSPMVLGLGKGETLIASDIPALLSHTRSVLLMEDGDFASLSADEVKLTDLNGVAVQRSSMQVTWDDEAAERCGYPHFMLKEINECARTVRETMRGRFDKEGNPFLSEFPLTEEDREKCNQVTLVGCGTAYHAGVVAKRWFEQLLHIPVEAAFASEFRYSDPPIGPHTLAVFISQSGETADTLAAMREARKRGARTLSIVNVAGSALSRESETSILTQAGPEIGVASTKAYLAQLTLLSILGLHLAGKKSSHSSLAEGLIRIPDLLEQCLELEPQIEQLAENLINHRTFFFLGRGYDYATSLEAALKLKEISYLHAEAYPAGEMKHGPLALVEPGVAIVGLCTQIATYDKMISNLKEVKAREGTVLAILPQNVSAPDCTDYILRIPDAPDELMPFLAIVPLQLLAYHVARARGCSIDQPRNLAKSVTVE